MGPTYQRRVLLVGSNFIHLFIVYKQLFSHSVKNVIGGGGGIKSQVESIDQIIIRL